MSLTYDQIKEVAERFPRAKYIAMDENGEAWTYSVKPVCHYGLVIWDASIPDFDMRYVREINYYHHPRQDWRDSLINIEQVLASGPPPSATNPTPICQEPHSQTPAQYNTAREYSQNNIITISHTIQWNSQTGAIKLSPAADWITPSNSDTQL